MATRLPASISEMLSGKALCKYKASNAYSHNNPQAAEADVKHAPRFGSCSCHFLGQATSPPSLSFLACKMRANNATASEAHCRECDKPLCRARSEHRMPAFVMPVYPMHASRGWIPPTPVSRSSECNLIWKHVHCRCNESR